MAGRLLCRRSEKTDAVMGNCVVGEKFSQCFLCCDYVLLVL